MNEISEIAIKPINKPRAVKNYKNLLDKSKINRKLILKPYETLWLSNLT